MVDFNALADALEPHGWFVQKNSNIEWVFIKQQAGTGFRKIRVVVDGTAYFEGSANRKMCPFRVLPDQWDVMNIIEQYTKGIQL